MTTRLALLIATLGVVNCGGTGPAPVSSTDAGVALQTPIPVVTTHSVAIDGVNIFYREVGDPAKPTIICLHGFPASSHEFRNLMVDLGGRYHLVAPDYPGFGFSDAPSTDAFTYTFDNVTAVIDAFVQQLNIPQYSLYVHDYGGAIGFNIAMKHPAQIKSLIIQNAVAYADGFSTAFAPLQQYWMDPVANKADGEGFLTADATKFQYTQGTTDPSLLSPEAWTLDQSLLDRPGEDTIQLALLFDIQHDIPKFPNWQAYFRANSPPTLITWGKGDPLFLSSTVAEFQKDLPAAEVDYLDAGHFALEDRHHEIAAFIDAFEQKLASQ